MSGVSDEEIRLEQDMAELGIGRYRSRVEKALLRGVVTSTPAGRYLLNEACAKTAAYIDEWLKTAQSKPGARHSSVQYLNQLDPELSAFLAVRCILNALTAGKHQATLLRVALAVGGELQDELRYQAMRKQAKVAWKRVMAKTRTATTKHKRKALRGVMSRVDFDMPTWPKRERLKAGLVMVEALRTATGLIATQKVRVKNLNGSRLGRHATRVLSFTAEASQWLSSSTVAHEALFPIYMPTLQPPADWTTPFDGGYHTNLLARRPLVSLKGANGRGFLKTLAATPMPEVYDAVNTLQATAYEINPVILYVLRDLWDAGIPVADLVSRDDTPLPYRDDEITNDPDRLREWKRKAAGVYRDNIALRSQRVQTSRLLFMAERFEERKFWYPYQADFRGRLYCVPYFLQPQGTGQARALLRFAEGRPITQPSEARWLAIHGANCFGFDKVPFDAREKWVHANEAAIREVHHDPLHYRWWTEADKPWEFLAFCLEWGDFKDTGYGFVSKLPIAMDGSNNGLQVFSLLLRDQVGAAATNCAPADAPRDIYADVADLVTRKLIRAETAGDVRAADWLRFVTLMAGGRLPRECAKRPVMTLPYGATHYSCRQYVHEWYRTATSKTTAAGLPLWPQTDEWGRCAYLADLVWESIGETVTAAKQCMAWLQQVAALCHKHSLPLCWTSPSGFPVHQAYSNSASERVRTSIGDSACIVKYRTDAPGLSKRKQVNGISPNYIHSLDAAALVKTVNLAAARGVSNFAMIHDSFGTTCVEADVMASALREAYALMFSENQLERFRDELQQRIGPVAQLPPLPPFGTFDVNDVLRSAYFFA